MSYLDLLTHSITVFNPTDSTEGRYGNEEETWDDGVEERGLFQPGTQRVDQREDLLSRDTMITRYTVFLSPDTATTAYSRIEWEGRNYRVYGVPDLYHDRHGELHHVEAMVDEVVG